MESAEAQVGVIKGRAGEVKHVAWLELVIPAERRSGDCSSPCIRCSLLRSYRWEYSLRKNNLVSLRKSLYGERLEIADEVKGSL